MKPSHDATLLAHRQIADLQQHRQQAGLAALVHPKNLQQHRQQAGLAALVHPKSPARTLLHKRNDSSPVRDPPPSPPLLKYRRVHSQQASVGATKRSHGASRLAPRSHFLDEEEIDAFDCLYLGASPEDAAEYQARCVDNSGVSLQRVKRDKGKRKAEDQDTVHDLERRAAPRTRPLVFAVASATTTSRTFLHTPRVLPNAAVSTTSLSPAQSSASRSRALASSSSSRSSAAAASSRASVSSSSAASASRSAASRVASRASILNAQTPGLLASVQGAFTDAASVVSSRSASIASATATSRTTSSRVASTSASSSTSASTPVSTSSELPSSSATPSSSSNSNPIRDIVVPSVVIPVVLLLLALFCFFCQRRRREPKGGRTPSSFGAISHPMRSPFGSPYATYGAAGATAGVGAGVGAAGLGGARGNPSAESFATTPSAIGVAFSEPRTKWGRRSLNDVVAAGAVGAGSAAAAGKGRGQVISASSSFGGGRQPSITNMSEISDPNSSRAYSPTAYRPGMPRPLVAPPGQHYDPFQAPPSIVPVAARGSSTAWAAASSGSNSAYGSEGDGESLLGSDDRNAALAPPIASASASPYSSPQAQQAQRSRVDTQTSGEDVFYTDVASSLDDGEEELTARQAPVDFGSSGSSGSEGVAGVAAGGTSPGKDGTPRQRAPSTSPSQASTPSSRNGTPRLGAGHGSMGGVRKGDGSWW